MKAGNFLTEVVRKVYESRVGEFIKKLGLLSVIVSVYWRLLSVTLDEHQDVSVGSSNILWEMDSIFSYRAITYMARCEDPVIKDIQNNINSGDVFWDVGANMGVYTSSVGSSTPEVRVHSFEPVIDLIVRCYSNGLRNNVDVTPHNIALWNCNEEIDISLMSHTQGQHSVVSDVGEDTVPVTAVRADDYIRKNSIEEPDILKIDVEGAESQVLEGAEEIISGCRIVYIEPHSENIEMSEIKSKIKDLGFSIEEMSLEYRRDDEIYLKGVDISHD